MANSPLRSFYVDYLIPSCMYGGLPECTVMDPFLFHQILQNLPNHPFINLSPLYLPRLQRSGLLLPQLRLFLCILTPYARINLSYATVPPSYLKFIAF